MCKRRGGAGRRHVGSVSQICASNRTAVQQYRTWRSRTWTTLRSRIWRCRPLRYKGDGLQPMQDTYRNEGWCFALVLQRFFVAQFFWASGGEAFQVGVHQRKGRRRFRGTGFTLSRKTRRITGLGRSGACPRHIGVGVHGRRAWPALNNTHRACLTRQVS